VTDEPGDVMSVETILNTQTPVPVRFRFPVSMKLPAEQYVPGERGESVVKSVSSGSTPPIQPASGLRVPREIKAAVLASIAVSAVGGRCGLPVVIYVRAPPLKDRPGATPTFPLIDVLPTFTPAVPEMTE
jgi:hypothetical protein